MFASAPFIKEEEVSPPNSFPSSIASSITTFGGSFLLKSSSKTARRKIAKSILFIFSTGNSGAASSIILSILEKLAIIFLATGCKTFCPVKLKAKSSWTIFWRFLCLGSRGVFMLFFERDSLSLFIKTTLGTNNMR